MRKLSLDGDWQLAHCPDGEGSIATLDRLEWIPAQVPGEVHWDLLRAGKIDDPFFDLNHLKMRPLEEHEFWYRRQFHVPPEMSGERVELVFEGLDCFATVWLNGLCVGRSANALVPRVFDVTTAVRPGEENEIVVRLASPLKAVEGKDLTGCAAAMDTKERLWARKSDQCYGWDIALRLVTVGIWRPVTLVAYDRAILRDFFLRTTSLAEQGAAAQVVLEVEVEALTAAEAGLSVEATAICGDSRLQLAAPVRDGKAVMEATVVRPKLWWTWDLGEPHLYALTIVLREGPQELGRRQAHVGLRTIRLLQEPPGGRERSFVFELNGVRFFARGLNWTPCDAIYPRAEPWKQQRLVRLARQLNCNMLRVWGGGIYEPDQFYAECDRQGIMLFHDFLYACAIYPQVPEFLELAREEAETAVRRLRNHPSLALWCGDNEVDCAYWWWFGEHRDPWTENKITRQVLPEVVARLDGTRPYRPFVVSGLADGGGYAGGRPSLAAEQPRLG
jgi:beta-mannosidase